jgi:hypothetical protein
MINEYDPRAVDELLPPDGWVKSSFSNGNGTGCVEFNITGTHVGVRDSNHPLKGAQVYDHEEWGAFLLAVKNGEADLPA